MSGGGRPAGPSQATIELGRELYALHRDYDVPVARIAAGRGIGTSWAHKLVEIGRDNPPPGTASPSATYPADSDVAPESPPRRVPLNTALRRMFDAKKSDRVVQLLTPDLREFWVEAVADILQRSEDGVELPFGRKGRVYPTQARFLQAFQRPAADLEALFYDGLLVDLDGAGIALPYGYGLRPKPGKPARRPGPDQAGASDRRQGFILHTFPSAVRDSSNTGVFEESDSSNTPVFEEQFEESGDFAHAAAAAALSDKIQPLSSSSLLAEGARDSSKTPVFEESDSSNTPVFEESRAGPIPAAHPDPAAPLAAELCGLARIANAPAADDLQFVRRWLAEGATPDDLRAEILEKTLKATRAIGKLMYFDGPMRDRMAAKRGGAGRTVPPIAVPRQAEPALSEEDRALRERLRPSQRAGWDQRHTHPKGASPEAWMEALAAGKEPLAERWLSAWTAWNAAGAAQGHRPPNFVLWKLAPAEFEQDLRAVEEALTDPGGGAGP